MVRVYHQSKAASGPSGALIYLHGGGFVVRSLDQFETAMRRLCEGSGVQVYAVDYKLACLAATEQIATLLGERLAPRP